MKKLLIILISILTIFALSSCDILELSAPEAETSEETSTTPETTTVEGETTEDNTTEDETYADGSHVSCEYCGQLEGEKRWFIARMKNDKAYPLGDNCHEDNASCGEGIYVSSRATDGYTQKNGDFVKITYDGTYMETIPLQMIAHSIVILDYDDVPHKNLSLSDCFVERGDVSMTLGDTSFYPICGFAYSYTEEYDSETGMWTSYCADGAGVYSYLDAIFKGDIGDKEMPAITASGDFELTVSGGGNVSGYYVDAQTFENKTLDIQNISSLPGGEYYVVVRIERGKSGYEYVFKLQVTE